jgi:hypothetical protein
MIEAQILFYSTDVTGDAIRKGCTGSLQSFEKSLVFHIFTE